MISDKSFYHLNIFLLYTPRIFILENKFLEILKIFVTFVDIYWKINFKDLL